MRQAKATVHGAVSVVNAIATGKGATLGISLSTTATVTASSGQGISIKSGQSSRLLAMTVQNMVRAADLARNHISISISSQLPTGCGLKSSSATSTAVAMACATLFEPDASEKRILSAGVDASIRSGISITGAFDDACGCFYGGFNVTNNTKVSLVARHRAPSSLVSIIHVPVNRRRRNVRLLRNMSGTLERAWRLASDGRFWDAMTLNGLAISHILGPKATLLDSLYRGGALAASMSGNGPSVAAIVRSGGEREIKNIFTSLGGHVIVSPINNTVAASYEL